MKKRDNKLGVKLAHMLAQTKALVPGKVDSPDSGEEREAPPVIDVLHNRSINWMRWTEYHLTENGVKIREKDLSGVRENSVEYDRIGHDATYFLRHSAIAKFGIIVFLIISLLTGVVRVSHGDAEKFAWLFWLGAAAVTFIYYENTKRKGFRLASAYSSLVISGKESRANLFLENLWKKKIAFIQQNVERRLAIMERAEVERYILALRDGAVLSTEQYDTLRIRTGLQPDAKPKMGFL